MLKPSVGQAMPSSRQNNHDDRSQKSRNNEVQAVKFKQAHENHQKEPMSATMTQQTPRLGNDDLKNQASGKKNAMHKLSLKKLEQSQPSPNRQLTDMHTGRDSKYLLVEDLNSEMMPNKPFDSHVSVSGGRALNPQS